MSNSSTRPGFEKIMADAQDLGDAVIFLMLSVLKDVINYESTGFEASAQFAEILNGNIKASQFPYYVEWMMKLNPHLKRIDGSDENFDEACCGLQEVAVAMIRAYPR